MKCKICFSKEAALSYNICSYCAFEMLNTYDIIIPDYISDKQLFKYIEFTYYKHKKEDK